MKTIGRILIILVVFALISGAAGLIIKATDPGAAAEPAKQGSSASNGTQALNREQPSQGGTSQAKSTGSNSSAVSPKVTLENLGKMALVVAGVWGIEKSAKNRRRTKPAPAAVFRSQPARLPSPRGEKIFLPRVNLDFYGKWDREEAG